MKKKVVYAGLTIVAIACLMFLAYAVTNVVESLEEVSNMLFFGSLFIGMSGIFIMVIGYTLEEKTRK